MPESLVYVSVSDYNTGKKYNFYAQNSGDILDSLKDVRVYNIHNWDTLHPGNERGMADLLYARTVLQTAANYRYVDLPLLNYWTIRERDRIGNGKYESLPDSVIDDLQIDPMHFLHIPTEKHDDLTMISYTESADKGRRDKHTVCRLGRYLNRYHPALTPEQVQDKVKAYRAYRTPENFELKIASDVKTINEIFETRMSARDGSGCVSCMYEKFADWTARPYHVYTNSPNVAIAYACDGSGIIARTVINTYKKEYVRIYSVLSRNSVELTSTCRETLCSNFANLLESNGYTLGNLLECKIRKIVNDGGNILAPYLDGHQHVKDTNDGFFRVTDTSNYTYTFAETDGYPSGRSPEEIEDEIEDEYSYACENCEFQTNDESDLTRTVDGLFCENCASNYIEATYNARGNTRLVHVNNTATDCDGDTYTQSYAENNLTYRNGEYHTSDCAHLETECDNCSYGTTDPDNDLEDGLCSDCATIAKTCVDCDLESASIGDFLTCDPDSKIRCNDCKKTYDEKIERKEYQNANQHMFTY